MVHGYLRSILQDVIADGTTHSTDALCSIGARPSKSQLAASFLASGTDPSPPQLAPHQPQRRGRHAAHLSSFTDTAPAGTEEADEDIEQDAKDPMTPFPKWANLEGLPKVTLASRNDKYFAPDLAEGAGDGEFKPIFGCKCGDWQPAPTHPTIQFRDTFLESNPLFIRKLRKLKVHMTDDTVNKVHWDATYDVRRFLSAEERARANQPKGRLQLKDTTPADKGSGTQLRFMTFCPPEPNPGDDFTPPEEPKPHEYTMKVTALDADENPIDDFIDQESRYIATPPEAPTPPGPGVVPTGALDKNIVAVARKSEG